jgi:hypothetical protein
MLLEIPLTFADGASERGYESNLPLPYFPDMALPFSLLSYMRPLLEEGHISGPAIA